MSCRALENGGAAISQSGDEQPRTDAPTQLVDGFIATLGDPRRQASTARAYRDDLRQLCQTGAFEGVTDLAGLTRPVLLRWTSSAAEHGYASARRSAGGSRLLQAFFRYLDLELGWFPEPGGPPPAAQAHRLLLRAYDLATAQADPGRHPGQGPPGPAQPAAGGDLAIRRFPVSR